MKVYWCEENKRIVFDLEGAEIRGDFSKTALNENPPEIRNGVFYNTGATIDNAILPAEKFYPWKAN